MTSAHFIVMTAEHFRRLLAVAVIYTPELSSLRLVLYTNTWFSNFYEKELQAELVEASLKILRTF